ncbi:MAG: hypothetical protein KatS3mg048_2938 [Caldilinea sp.]|nr:MAG: hypothetical protein KatS3mg048_2938 [Caldilinea sp.]
MRDKTKRFDRWVSITSLVVSAIAVVFAWQANKIAREANELTQQSIRLAQESNRIALLDKTDPQTIRGTGTIPLFVYGCKYPSSDLYYIYSITDVYITFANNGGKVATLSQVELMGTPYSWSVKVYQDDAEINLPVQILPGVETRLQFVATSVSNGESETNIRAVYEERYHSSPMLRWTFYFNDGRVIVWETQAYGSSPGLDFSRSCDE